MMAGRKTLEINGNHPVVHDLLQKVKDNKEDKNAIATAETLFQAAMLESGYEMSDPSDLVNKVYGLMSKQLGVDPNAGVKDIELPEEPEAEEEETEDDDDSKDKGDDKKEGEEETETEKEGDDDKKEKEGDSKEGEKADDKKDEKTEL